MSIAAAMSPTHISSGFASAEATHARTGSASSRRMRATSSDASFPNSGSCGLRRRLPRRGMVKELTRCISLNAVCADVCATTGAALSRQLAGDQQLLRTPLEACAQACKSCGDECERHGEMHEHCRVCAEACRACEQSCRNLLAA